MTIRSVPPAAPPTAPRACPNCGSLRAEVFCAACGQRMPAPDDYRLRSYAGELLDQVTTADGKGVRTLAALIGRPGRLTVDHLAGRRARYLRPLQLFLLANLLLFVSAPRVPLFSYSLKQYRLFAPPSPRLVERLVERVVEDSIAAVVPADRSAVADRGEEALSNFTASFDGRVEAQRKSLLVLFAPVLALVLRLVFWRGNGHRPRRYGEHLVFVLHVLAYVWLALAVLGTLAAIPGWLRAAVPRLVLLPIALALLSSVPVYVLLASRRAYALSWPRAGALTVAMGLAFTALLFAYRGLLFFTTYYTL